MSGLVSAPLRCRAVFVGCAILLLLGAALRRAWHGRCSCEFELSPWQWRPRRRLQWLVPAAALSRLLNKGTRMLQSATPVAPQGGLFRLISPLGAP